MFNKMKAVISEKKAVMEANMIHVPCKEDVLVCKERVASKVANDVKGIPTELQNIYNNFCNKLRSNDNEVEVNEIKLLSESECINVDDIVEKDNSESDKSYNDIPGDNLDEVVNEMMKDKSCLNKEEILEVEDVVENIDYVDGDIDQIIDLAHQIKDEEIKEFAEGGDIIFGVPNEMYDPDVDRMLDEYDEYYEDIQDKLN